MKNLLYFFNIGPYHQGAPLNDDQYNQILKSGLKTEPGEPILRPENIRYIMTGGNTATAQAVEALENYLVFSEHLKPQFIINDDRLIVHERIPNALEIQEAIRQIGNQDLIGPTLIFVNEEIFLQLIAEDPPNPKFLSWIIVSPMSHNK
jgi:hypothetical protein